MNQDLGLRILGRIMDWDDDRARKEFAWLKLMARLKYDGYRDFQAGMRFIDSLATWLQQFKSHERETAYAFVAALSSTLVPARCSGSSSRSTRAPFEIVSSAWWRPSAASRLIACSSTRMLGRRPSVCAARPCSWD